MNCLKISVFLFMLLSVSCASNKGEEITPPDVSFPYYIEWNKNSLVCIAPQGGYPRMRKLKDNSLLVVYENYQGDVLAKRSFDGGSHWENEVMAYEGFTFSESSNSTKVNVANPEIIELPDGDILLACNLRPQQEGIFPFSIAIKRSGDKGLTWSEAKIIYQAGKEFKNGCWEPSFLLLPNGNIHLYFANESPYRNSDEQEISLLQSSDRGQSWSPQPTTVSFRKNHRDGMPVAVHNNQEIFVAIEDNVSKEFKPYIVKNPLENSWKEPVSGTSDFRYAALENALPNAVYAGAPYLIYTNSGFYVISYQTTENRTTNWELSTMKVAISKTPNLFKNPSEPFEVPLSKEAKWNSLTDLGNNEIAALTSSNFNAPTTGVWLIKGKIIENSK